MDADTMEEIFKLKRAIENADGQAEVVFLDLDLDDDGNDETDDDRPITLYFIIEPNGGYYKGGRIKFKLVLGNYPFDPPKVYCCNAVYHPNIFTLDDDENAGLVCLNLLENDWTLDICLDDCVMAVLSLFYNPQFYQIEGGLYSGFSEDGDLSVFAENVKISMRGGDIDSVYGGEVYNHTFDNIMINDSDEENENGQNKADEHSGECESSSVLAGNVKIPTTEKDIDANSFLEIAVEDEADKDIRAGLDG